MIARKNRFHGYGSLKYVYQNGKSIRGALNVLKYAPNPKRNDYRLAVVVSKKVASSAVTRNRIRRRLYETFRLAMPEEPTAYDIIVTVFSEQIVDLSVDKLTKLVHSQLKQAGIRTNAG